jgi:hypothetical protein
MTKGVLHCSYSCTVVKPDKKAQAAQLKNFGTRAKAAAAGMNVKDPRQHEDGEREPEKGPRRFGSLREGQ